MSAVVRDIPVYAGDGRLKGLGHYPIELTVFPRVFASRHAIQEVVNERFAVLQGMDWDFVDDAEFTYDTSDGLFRVGVPYSDSWCRRAIRALPTVDRDALAINRVLDVAQYDRQAAAMAAGLGLATGLLVGLVDWSGGRNERVPSDAPIITAYKAGLAKARSLLRRSDVRGATLGQRRAAGNWGEW